VWATAESDQHFEFLHELGKAISFPRPGADRAFLFAEVGITHKSLSVLIVPCPAYDSLWTVSGDNAGRP
jgi:hypothetical protein